MVAISRQYLSGADRAVQIRQAVFVDKGTQPELRHNKSKNALLIRVSDFLYVRHFLFQTVSNVQYCFIFCAHTTRQSCYEALTF